ncbi:MAG: hypothetical protein WBC02_04325 [Candidatus Aminicenantaceae bacterium]
MPVKKFDVGNSIEREHDEPKLRGKQPGRPGEEKIERIKASNNQSFELRLKKKPKVTLEKSVAENIQPFVENIEIGMTTDKVIEVMGKPREIFEWYSGNLKLNYSDLWVVIENGAVTCLVLSKDFEKYWGKSDYHTRNPEAIIK